MIQHIQTQTRNALIVNFGGIGNGIILVPILQCVEKSCPNLYYFHVDNPILKNRWFRNKSGLRNLKGFAPLTWRRFNRQDWNQIYSFLSENEIELVINLRNEGPEYDKNYYKFKNWIYRNNKITVDFWELDFKSIINRDKQVLVSKDILSMFKTHGVRVNSYNSAWLMSNKIQAKTVYCKRVGLGTGAGQVNKRWPLIKWLELADLIFKEGAYKIEIFSGNTKEEKEFAYELHQKLAKKHSKEICILRINKTLPQLTRHIIKLDLFVSNDSGLIHLAGALGISTLGIYICTDPSIWGVNSAGFVYLFNTNFFQCSRRKKYCGNCLHYYGLCPTIRKYGDGIKAYDAYRHIKNGKQQA